MRLARVRVRDTDRIEYVRWTPPYWYVLKDPFRSLEDISHEVLLDDEATLLAPVAPPNVLAIGRNYRAHAEETGSAVPDHPLLFLKATTAVIAPDDPIVLPGVAPDKVDCEAELAVVIGREARKVSPENALDHVLGYTCGNDVSARDCQLELDAQWARGKSFDTFCPLGPWIETELDPTDLGVRSTINNNPLQGARTSDMIFPVRELISYLSHSLTLVPGTVILSGTPPGVGMAWDPPVYLQPGDNVHVSVDGIGTISNPVVADA